MFKINNKNSNDVTDKYHNDVGVFATCQTSMMEIFAKILNNEKFVIVVKCFSKNV